MRTCARGSRHKISNGNFRKASARLLDITSAFAAAAAVTTASPSSKIRFLNLVCPEATSTVKSRARKTGNKWRKARVCVSMKKRKRINEAKSTQTYARRDDDETLEKLLICERACGDGRKARPSSCSSSSSLAHALCCGTDDRVFRIENLHAVFARIERPLLFSRVALLALQRAACIF